LPKKVVSSYEAFWLKSVDKFTNDRIVIVFASDKPIDDKQTIEIKKLLEYAHDKLGTMIDIEFISIKTIYTNAVKENEFSDKNPLKIPITATLSNSDTNLLVGTIKLRDLYWFLREYKIQTGNLDQIFEKNIRRFLGLGSDGPINQAMQSTLIDNPAQFGLYNNGVTIVVEAFEPVTPETTDSYNLFEPYIVNGCQTTRTIWEVFRQKYEAGRGGLTPELIKWQGQIANGLVVVKIVKVGNEGEPLLHNITKYTNSQNAVKERDFITLEKGFEYLQSELATKYDIFLEIQRGEWDSQKAWQKSSTSVHQFSKYANTFELLKVYGAGWLREAATAFSSNEKFLPGGDLYRQIVLNRKPPFNVDDLYAAYQLSTAGIQNNFGRKATKLGRRQTRYLFYLIAIDLLKDVMMRGSLSTSAPNITNAILKLTKNNKKEAWNTLVEAAVNTIDEYLNQLEEDSIFNEPNFDSEFNRNLSAYLKSSKLGQAEFSPRFASLLAINKRTMGRGQPSPRDIITEIISN
jgi:hypothetical protein